MTIANLISAIEPLEPEEFQFLVRRVNKEENFFYRMLQIMIVLSFILPFGVAWYNASEGENNPFSPLRYFLGVGLLLSFTDITMYVVYSKLLKGLIADLKIRKEIVELTHVKRKLYMPQNNTYHIFLTSATKISIEVREMDFRRLEAGDEVNIEYAQFSKIYFGYF